MIYPAHYLEIVLADVIGGYGGRGEGLLQTKHNAAVTGGGEDSYLLYFSTTRSWGLRPTRLLFFGLSNLF